VQEFSGPDGEVLAEIAAMPGGDAHADVQDYAMELERWGMDPRVSLAEVHRTVTPPTTGEPLEPELGRRVRALEEANSRMERTFEEIREANPHVYPPKRVALRINGPL
jgi:hypothetical protein